MELIGLSDTSYELSPMLFKNEEDGEFYAPERPRTIAKELCQHIGLNYSGMLLVGFSGSGSGLYNPSEIGEHEDFDNTYVIRFGDEEDGCYLFIVDMTDYFFCPGQIGVENGEMVRMEYDMAALEKRDLVQVLDRDGMLELFYYARKSEEMDPKTVGEQEDG